MSSRFQDLVNKLTLPLFTGGEAIVGVEEEKIGMRK
jgi:hypothetical protein